jgi:hypothetical protein
MPRPGGVRTGGGLGQKKGGGGGGGGGGGPSPHQGMKSKKQLEREREQQIHSTRQNLFGSQGAKLQQQAAAKAALARQEEDRRKQKAIQAEIDAHNKATAQKVLEQQRQDAIQAEIDAHNKAAAEKVLADKNAAALAADEEQRRIQKAEEQASNFRPPVFETAPSEDILKKNYGRPPVFETQPMKGGIIENYQTLPKIVADNPNIFGQNANPNDYEIMTDEFGNDVVYTKDLKQKMGTVGLVEDLPGWLGMGAGMLFGKDTPMFTADPLLAQEKARAAGDRGGGNELGLSPAVYTQIQAEAQAAAAAEAEAAAATQQPSSTEEILTGFAPQYTTSPATSGIATVPTTGNYMDYMQYAFRPVNTANPWAGSPTQNITGYNPLFADNPVYAADGGRIGFKPGGSVGEYSWSDFEIYPEATYWGNETIYTLKDDPEMGSFNAEEVRNIIEFGFGNYRKGGRVGKMSGGMMIMGDNGVVNNGIGGILSKYKEIRSEL